MGRSTEADKSVSWKAEPRNSLRTAKKDKETERTNTGQKNGKINPNVTNSHLTDLQKARTGSMEGRECSGSNGRQCPWVRTATDPRDSWAESRTNETKLLSSMSRWNFWHQGERENPKCFQEKQGGGGGTILLQITLDAARNWRNSFRLLRKTLLNQHPTSETMAQVWGHKGRYFHTCKALKISLLRSDLKEVTQGWYREQQNNWGALLFSLSKFWL